MAYKAWLANKSSLELRSQYSEARKAAAKKLNCRRKVSGRNLEKGFTMISKRQTKCSGTPFAVCVEKDLEPLFHRRFQWCDSERSRCYFESVERILYFSDLLNLVDATPIQIHEEQVGEDIQITEADVNAVIKSLKTGKALPG